MEIEVAYCIMSILVHFFSPGGLEVRQVFSIILSNCPSRKWYDISASLSCQTTQMLLVQLELS